MISLRARLVKSLLRLYTFPVRLRHGSLSRSAKFSDADYEPEGMDTQARICGGVRVETLVPPSADGLLIHFHGGGHTARMNDFYRRAAGRYALAGFVVHSIDYEAGAPVKLTVYKGMFHDFQYLFPRLPESRRAWDEIYSFLRGAAGSG